MVTGLYRNDAMIRQITEAVKGDRADTNVIIYEKAEWNKKDSFFSFINSKVKSLFVFRIEFTDLHI